MGARSKLFLSSRFTLNGNSKDKLTGNELNSKTTTNIKKNAGMDERFPITETNIDEEIYNITKNFNKNRLLEYLTNERISQFERARAVKEAEKHGVLWEETDIWREIFIQID
jgi:hypothetical protein